jgi:hypothetical protein
MKSFSKTSIISTILLDMPWANILGDTWKYFRKLVRGFSLEGMYEVLDYESILELLDVKGKKAHFSKRKKVRYLQDHIIAHQDHAWGDGDILLDYQTSNGKLVDQYRSGYKTLLLLSLQEIKNRGDIDEFNISWGIKNGFLKSDGFWDTDITQKTKKIKIQVIFPKDRHPRRVTIFETNRHRTHYLGDEYRKLHPDGRLCVCWEKKNPKLYEHYLMKWRW